MPGFPLFPDRASTMAGQVDLLFLFLVVVSAFFVLLIAGLVVFFAIRYRRRDPAEVGARVRSSLALEMTWTIVPAVLGLVMFSWGARLYFDMTRAPSEAMDVYVVGKQWMWKFQHPTGPREINELHVPVGRNVRLTMTSEDVIHSFFVPGFRLKTDVLPGRYTSQWFQATKPGRYALFCAEYCGTRHSAMTGWIVAMEPSDYQAWLAGGGEATMAASGRKLFADRACVSCHRADSQGRGPVLDGLFGTSVALTTGQVVTADEAYLRESILNPAAKVAAGFQPIMPTFQGLLDEEQLLQLVEYIKTLGAKTGAEPPGAPGAPGAGTSPDPVAPHAPGTGRK